MPSFTDEVANILGPWGTFLTIIALALLLAITAGRAGVGVLRAFTSKTKNKLDDIVVASLWPAAAVLMFAALMWLGMLAFDAYLPWQVSTTWGGLQTTLVVGVVAYSLVRLLRGVMEYRVVAKPHLRPIASLGGRAASLIVWVTAALFVLGTYHVELGPVLTSLGIAGIAVALALEDTLANFFAGIWIQGSKAFRPAHFVRVEELKVDGFIDEVGWRTTRIRTLSGNLVVIPNKTMSSHTVTDFTLPDSKMGTNLTFTVGFETDPDRVLKIALEEMQEAVKENPNLFVAHPEPGARLNGITERGFEIWCGFWVPFYWVQWNAQASIRMRIARRFAREGIRFPYVSEEGYAMPERRTVADRERQASFAGAGESEPAASPGVVGKGPGAPVSQEG